MNETDLILGALNGGAPVKSKRMVIPEIEPPVVAYDSVLAGLAKRGKKRPPRKRPIGRWGNADFLRYVDEALGVEGLVLESSGVRDRELMGKLYDCLAEHFQDRMTNERLRKYIDWWVHSYARILRQRSIYPQMLLLEKYVEAFITDYDVESLGPAIEGGVTTEEPVDLSDHALFDLGGLPMLLMTEGIVVAYKVLRERNEDHVYRQISVALRGLSRDVVEKVMDVTLSKKPYNSKYAIDFLSVAKSALEYYRIKKYADIKYEESFG